LPKIILRKCGDGADEVFKSSAATWLPAPFRFDRRRLGPHKFKWLPMALTWDQIPASRIDFSGLPAGDFESSCRHRCVFMGQSPTNALAKWSWA
jgi:hypothetical protein